MDDELPTEGGVATRIPDGRFSGSEYMVTSITVPREAAGSGLGLGLGLGFTFTKRICRSKTYIFKSKKACEKSVNHKGGLS